MKFIELHYWSSNPISTMKSIIVNAAEIETLEVIKNTASLNTEVVLRSGTRFSVKEYASNIRAELGDG